MHTKSQFTEAYNVCDTMEAIALYLGIARSSAYALAQKYNLPIKSKHRKIREKLTPEYKNQIYKSFGFYERGASSPESIGKRLGLTRYIVEMVLGQKARAVAEKSRYLDMCRDYDEVRIQSALSQKPTLRNNIDELYVVTRVPVPKIRAYLLRCQAKFESKK